MHQVELGEIAEFINGAAFKPEDWGEDGQRIIRIQNLNDPTKPFNRTNRHVSEKYHVHTGTLLVSWSASLGVFEWNEPDTALLNQHIFKVVPDTRKVRQDYLRFMLSKALIDMEKHAHGSTMLHVNRGEFLGTKIPLPPLEEQKRIAAILDQADDIRRKRQHGIDRLNQLGQAIFHEMFGDPATNPKGWKIGKIDDLTASTQYGTSSKAGESGDYPILRMGNLLYSGEMDFSTLKFINFKANELEKYTVRSGDILFNRTNSPDLVGKTAVYYGEEPMGFAGYLVRLRVNDRAVSEFISAYLNSGYGKAILRGMCKAIIGMANINAKELRGIPIPLPPIDLQQEFKQKITTIRDNYDVPNAQLKRLDSLYTSLQHRAFAGEL